MTQYPTKSRPRYEFFLRFLLIAGSALLVMLCLAHRYFPRQWSQFDQIMNPGAQTMPMWQRLLSSGRAESGKEQTKPSEEVRASQSSGGQYRTVQDEDHLSLRETVLAQSYLQDRYKRDRKSAWSTVKHAKSRGPFREYEETRFVRETLWREFEEKENRARIIDQLLELSRKTAASEHAFFEDFFYAGLAELFAGNSKAAATQLERALTVWPAPGRARGNVFLALMIAYAAEGKSREVLEMLYKFKQEYPDWFYVETYMEDFEDLQKVYSDKPLLWLIRGRLVQIVNDYSSATECYEQAKNGLKDDGVSRIIELWQHEIRPPGGRQ